MKRLLPFLLLFVCSQAFSATSAVSRAGGGSDDLGNHTATQDLNMATHNVTNVGSISGDTSLNYSFYLSGQLFYWVGSSDDLSTAISNASAGSTIYLAEGTYTEASTMTIDKSLRIIGSGRGKTIITCSMTSTNCFTITASNVFMSDMTINQTISSTGASTVRFDGSAGTVISGAGLDRVIVNQTDSNTGTSRGVTVTSASGDFNDIKISMTCSAASGNCYGIQFFGDASQEAAVTLNVNNPIITTNSSNSNTAVGIKVQDSSSTTDNILNVYGGSVVSTESGGTPTTYAIACDTGTNAVCHLHGGYYSGVDNDIRVVNSATVTLDNVTAAHNLLSSGLMVRDGTIHSAGAILTGPEATDATLDIVADDGDDTPDTWHLKSMAATNNLDIVNGATTISSFNSNGLLIAPPADQTIAATNTITANACGTFKGITSSGAVTTSTTDTFTAPASTNAGCVMRVCNTGANNITLDNNANFKSAGATDVVMTSLDCVVVASNGTAWYQISALEAN